MLCNSCCSLGLMFTIVALLALILPSPKRFVAVNVAADGDKEHALTPAHGSRLNFAAGLAFSLFLCFYIFVASGEFVGLWRASASRLSEEPPELAARGLERSLLLF